MTDVARGAGPPAPRSDERTAGRRGIAAIIFDVRVLRALGQVVAIVVLIAFALYLNDNYQARVRDQRIRTGFGFLDEPTGFNIAFSDFRAGQPVRDALWVGVRNTAASAFTGMILATVLGLVVGILRLSRSWVARKAATLYVEVLRNVPVLLIILFCGAALQTLPRIGDAYSFADLAAISNRGLSIVSPVADDGLGAFAALLGVALVAALAVASWRTRVFDATGQPHHRVLWGGAPFLLVAVVGYVALGPITWSQPEIGARSVSGGASLDIPYVALTGALALYHGSHIAEIVRGSIQAVPHGQVEAADAIGLSEFQRLRFVVLPQAFRIAVPPTINQFLSLTKNTSLGIAVAYSDVSSLGFRLIGARAPALQTVIILMAVYLMFSLTTSLVLNMFNRRFQLVER
jgi:general L-amino acid transport system permease protein